MPESSETPETPETCAHFMRAAMAEAEHAATLGEVPVGAVIVVDGAIIGRGGNRRESAADPTAHAELLAIREAARTVGGWRLVGATLYVTQEPCPMCAGAIVNARVAHLVYGCDNPKAGAVRTLYQLVEDPRLNHRVTVVSGVLAAECGALLTGFFATPDVNSNLNTNLASIVGKTLWVEQLKAMGLTIVLSVGATAVIAYALKAVLGLRPTAEGEEQGLDDFDHGEAGYHPEEGGGHTDVEASMSVGNALETAAAKR